MPHLVTIDIGLQFLMTDIEMGDWFVENDIETGWYISYICGIEWAHIMVTYNCHVGTPQSKMFERTPHPTRGWNCIL